MKNKKHCVAIAAVLVLAVLSVSVCIATVFATGDDLKILPGTNYQPGDANLDEKINIRDATAIQKYLAKLTSFAPFQKELADIDQSGDVNVKDATYIQKLIAGIIKSSGPATEDESLPLRGSSGVTSTTSVVPDRTEEANTTESSEVHTNASQVVTDATKPVTETQTLPVPLPSTQCTTELTEATEDKDEDIITLPFIPAP